MNPGDDEFPLKECPGAGHFPLWCMSGSARARPVAAWTGHGAGR